MAFAAQPVTHGRHAYCFWSEGRPLGELPIYAPDAATADRTVADICEQLRLMGYDAVHATPGRCP